MLKIFNELIGEPWQLTWSTLYGYESNDTLAGESGNDVLVGGSGDDHIQGSDPDINNDGNDMMYGYQGPII